MASTTLLLPQPFGPTMAEMPSSNSKTVRSAKDLKPWISSLMIFMGHVSWLALQAWEANGEWHTGPGCR